MLHCRAMVRHSALLILLVVLFGCDDRERIARLEKQNQELKAHVDKSKPSLDYDLQGRCSHDAQEWFGKNSSRDKNTILLNFENHYNPAMNKCFIVVENHVKNPLENANSWANDMFVYDVQENLEYGRFIARHNIFLTPQFSDEEKVDECTVNGKTCKSLDEFNQMIHPYLSN